MTKYMLHEKLGEGGYSSVYKCTDSIGIRYACKVIPKQSNTRLKVQNEVNSLTLLNNSTKIPRLIDAIEDDTSFYLVQELCKGGALKHYVSKHDLYGENTVASITRGVLRGLCHIHEKGIIHRDIKGGNILFADKGDDAEVKIVDFGASLHLTDSINEEVHTKDIIGTPWFMSPEALNKTYTVRSDIWSLGVLVYHLLSGMLPFNDNNNILNPNLHVLWRCILLDDLKFKGKEWMDVSSDAQDFVRACLQKSYKDRIPAIECLKHPWIQKADCDDRFSGVRLSCMPFKFEDSSCMKARSITI